MPDHHHALPPGHMLADEYRIDRVLGSGGFGITYYAWDTHLDKPVAIKEYLPNEFAVRADASTVQPKSSGDRADYQWGLARFLDEARTLARFRHAHLNEVYRFFEGNGTAYMVLEYIDGETLSAVLRRDGRLAPEQLRRLLDELLTGLDEVHRAGYVHRDVKPGNIMLRTDGSAVLLDFGAARQAIGQRSKSITAILTPGYAPIEQYEQNAEGIGAWTDLYAVGMVAYRCLSGTAESELPDAVTRANWKRKGEHDRDLQPAVTVGEGVYEAGLLKAVDHAIEVYENDRPQSIAKMREVLAGGVVKSAAVAPVSSVTPISSIPSPPSPPISTARPQARAKFAGGGWKRAAPMLLAALVVGGVVAGLLPALDWWDWRSVNCANEAQMKAYLSARPGGRYAADAKSCLAAIAAIAAERKGMAAVAKAKVQRERFVRILGRDFSPHAKDRNGWTDLHYAAAADLSHVARLLIAAGADMNARMESSIHASIYHLDTLALTLVKHNLRQLLGRDVLYDSFAEGGSRMSPLHIAAWTNATKTAAVLLKSGADIAARDGDDFTPLHSAAWRNASKTAALLLKNGADIEAKNDGGIRPLHSAAWRNASKTAALLLKNGANIEAKVDAGWTPLHVAAATNADKTAALLLKNGANRYARDEYGDIPLDVAKRENSDKVIIILLQN